DLTLLKGFEFNQNAPLGTTVYLQPNLEISRDDEQTVAEYFNIVPTDHIVAPAGTTHFRMVNAALIIDFDSGYTFLDVVSSSENPYNGTLISSIQLITDLPADVTQPIFSLVGIEFLQQVNGSFYSLNNGAHNA